MNEPHDPSVSTDSRDDARERAFDTPVGRTDARKLDRKRR